MIQTSAPAVAYRPGVAAPTEAGWLRRKCACGGTPGPTGECQECRRKRLASARPIQTKLAIGHPEDRLEQEADRAAAAVVNGRSLAGSLGGNSGLVLSRQEALPSAAATTSQATEAPQEVHDALAQPGRPLDSPTREFMEARFGHDFSRVQIHAGPTAAISAHSVDARAYTVGHHVVFAGGEYAPHTPAGGQLLAHELAHVVQQSRNPAVPVIQRRALGAEDVIHRPLIERARESMGLLPGERLSPGEEAGIASGIKRTGPPVPPAGPLPACFPRLKDPDWDVAPSQVLMSYKGSKCDFQLFKASAPTGAKFGVAGMEFKGKLEVPRGCPGSVYYVQYAKPNRAIVACSDSKPFGECQRPDWGVDGGWPNAVGTVNDTAATAGTTVDTTTRDSPGVRNISGAGRKWVRICVADEEFVTYIVFEDAAGLTPLGWMNWKYSARLTRDTGKCPPQSTQLDCTGWKITGRGDKIRSRFAPGAMGPQPLNKSVAPVRMSSSACSEGDCPEQVVAPPTARPSPPTTSEESR